MHLHTNQTVIDGWSITGRTVFTKKQIYTLFIGVEGRIFAHFVRDKVRNLQKVRGFTMKKEGNF